VTWQPNADVRIASVVLPYNNGFVMAGRNMREVEQRESPNRDVRRRDVDSGIDRHVHHDCICEFVLAEK